MKFLKTFGVAAIVASAFAFATPAMAVVAHNANLVNGVYFGSGNDALPHQFTTNTVNGIEIGLRANIHPSSPDAGPQITPVGNTYYVPLGNVFNWNWSVDPSAGGSQVSLAGSTALLTVTNMLTNASISYDPSAILDNAHSVDAPGGYQNSWRPNFWFLAGLGFDEDQNNTFDISLMLSNVAGIGTIESDIRVQMGDGFNPVPAVPEPSTWAMMILGFAGVGYMAYRRRRSANQQSLTAA